MSSLECWQRRRYTWPFYDEVRQIFALNNFFSKQTEITYLVNENKKSARIFLFWVRQHVDENFMFLKSSSTSWRIVNSLTNKKLAFLPRKSAQKPSKSCFSTMIYLFYVFLFDFLRFLKKSIFTRPNKSLGALKIDFFRNLRNQIKTHGIGKSWSKNTILMVFEAIF